MELWTDRYDHVHYKMAVCLNSLSTLHEGPG